jgi:hypothetical protein
MSFHITLKSGFQIEEYSTYPSREERMHRSIKGQNERDLVGFNALRHWAIMYLLVAIGAVIGFRRGPEF